MAKRPRVSGSTEDGELQGRCVLSQPSSGQSGPPPTVLARNGHSLGVALRVIFGLVWLTDGAMKFILVTQSDLVSLVTTSGQGQPAWLAPWFNFWAGFVTSNSAFTLYGVGLWELILGFTLVFGLMRKLSYLSGILLSLVVYGVGEGFGGPYGPGSTDVGAAIIYVLVYVALIAFELSAASNRLTLDSVIEKRTKAWRKISEFS